MRRRGLSSLAATCAGIGWIPWAAGTWGSLVGLGLGVAIGSLSRPWAAAVLVATFVGCAMLCGAAEQELAQHDPPAVVLDEVWGMAAVVIALPQLRASWGWLVASLLLFRFFDIVKPPPLKRLALLPGGWGIMADDLGAAAYTALALWFLIHLVHFRF